MRPVFPTLLRACDYCVPRFPQILIWSNRRVTTWQPKRSTDDGVPSFVNRSVLI